VTLVRAADRTGRLRLAILGALAVDVAVALAVAVSVATPPRVQAWFQPGFPADLVVIENQGGALDGVVLELDGRWVARPGRLEPGVRGFEVTREFRAADGDLPPAEHRPRALRLVAEGEDLDLELEPRGGR
jgi:hypothetical protein